ncbi:MAG TPA: hypothetical protein VMB71_16485 [Acetobacteraceae bacterium]|nr:hypothetical protein [Acetobacteraceae bacterium]
MAERDTRRHEVGAVGLLVAVVFIAAYFARAFLAPGDQPWLAYVTDDFYYYAIIADRMAGGVFSSFDGLIRTNGYHPLWLAVVTVLRLVCGGTGTAFFVMLFATLAALATTATWQAHILLRKLNAPPGVAAFATILFAIGAAAIARTGMEVALALPLALVFIAELERVSRGGELRPCRLGLLASAAILARLDTAILVGLSGVAALPRVMVRRTTWPVLAGVGIGLMPVACYIITNLVLFRTILPISATAKALAPAPIFNIGAIGEIYWPPGGLLQRVVFQLPAWAALVAACVGLWQWPRQSTSQHLATAICAFPLVFYLLLAVRSDWVLWFWYLYPVVLAGPFAFARLLNLSGALRPAAWAAMGAAVAVAAIVVEYGNDIVDGHYVLGAARALRPFVAMHPGRYAMGDRAGLTSFITGQPILQLEGIVGDVALLRHIRASDDLMKVLQSHQINYYIGTGMADDGNGCRLAAEPKAAQAGPQSPAMTAKFCGRPLYRQADDGAGLETVIFPVLQGNTGLPPGARAANAAEPE